MRARGVDLPALRQAIGNYLSLGQALPPHFRAALDEAGVSTELDFDSRMALNLNHPLLALSNSIHSELGSRMPAAAQPRPAGLTRSPGLRRAGGETSPPQAAQARLAPREQTSHAPLETLRRAGIDPHAFNAAVANFLSFGHDLPADITAFLRNAGIPHHIDATQAFDGRHPLLAFDRQVRAALGPRTPAATRSRPMPNAAAGSAATLRRPTQAPLDSSEFDQSAVFAAPRRGVEGR
ncbi:hypothetical protein DWV00_01295 [Trinickia dinghuensis]|uniref:Uncharacterized protein n=1 Tax=Trinickia dinghuensis TaxID=2291023 RepID=A0A3D8K6F5_9BURK|nr:hypothetical protein DWV00_01295 [Trinickia dinghuensis]